MYQGTAKLCNHQGVHLCFNNGSNTPVLNRVVKFRVRQESRFPTNPSWAVAPPTTAHHFPTTSPGPPLHDAGALPGRESVVNHLTARSSVPRRGERDTTRTSGGAQDDRRCAAVGARNRGLVDRATERGRRQQVASTAPQRPACNVLVARQQQVAAARTTPPSSGDAHPRRARARCGQRGQGRAPACRGSHDQDTRRRDGQTSSRGREVRVACSLLSSCSGPCAGIVMPICVAGPSARCSSRPPDPPPLFPSLNHDLTIQDANGVVKAGVGIHLQHEMRYGIYVADLTPRGPGDIYKVAVSAHQRGRGAEWELCSAC